MRKAVILAAGEGTRLRPMTLDRPKVMLDVLGKPLLERQIEWLKANGIEQFYINLHYLPRAVADYFGDGSSRGVEIVYSFEKSLQGTAGSLRGFRGMLDETFLVHYGDVYSELDVRRMLTFHRDRGSSATLAVHPTTHPHDSDIVQLGPNARVAAVHHKPGTDRYGALGNAACYIVEPKLLNFLPPGPGPADFIIDVFPPMLAAGDPLYGYNTDEFMMDMGTPDRYEALLRRLGQ